MKPRLFVGSSTENLEICYALQSGLDGDAEVTVWSQDVFKPSEYILESLLKELGETDFGVFVFSPDDMVRVRGSEFPAVRDNVVFEIGLYVGRLGRERTFMVYPKGSNPKLPSDLLGINMVAFEGARTDGNVLAAVGPATSKIRAVLKKTGGLPRPVDEMRLPLLERLAALSGRQRRLLEAVEDVDPISLTDLGLAFPEYSKQELYYRLEQLRLMQFIYKSETRRDGQLATILGLTFAYRESRPQQLGTDLL